MLFRSIDTVAEQRMDDAAAVANRDQAGVSRRIAADPPHKTQPVLQRNAGVVQINKRIGRPGALPVHWKCLKLLIHLADPDDLLKMDRRWRPGH